MKKLIYLGLAATMALSVGCSTNEETLVSVTAADTDAKTRAVESSNDTSIDATKGDAEASALFKLENKDFEPLAKALYGLEEQDYVTINENDEITYSGYFDNLVAYRKLVKDSIGKYLSDELLNQLDAQDTKLDFDFPKLLLINNYIVSAKGRVDKVEFTSSRELGDHVIYEIAVTSSNEIQKQQEYFNHHKWDDERNYYVEGDPFIESEVPTSFVYTSQDNVEDSMKIVSKYWVEVSSDKKGERAYQVESIKQAGPFVVDVNDKQQCFNTQNVERVPYYEEVTDKQKVLLTSVFDTLMTQPQESYYYCDKIYGHTFSLVESFWKDIQLQDKIAVEETTYTQAFKPDINPYKDNVATLTLNKEQVEIQPSIYSTKLQPAFIVTLPVAALNRDNNTVYYAYKYFVSTELDKVEAIQFIRMDEITEEQYNKGIQAAAEEQAANGEQAANNDAQSTEGTSAQ